MSEDYPYADRDRSECIQLIPQTALHVLDVGCGQGAFGAAFKQSRPGTVVWGIEPDPTAAATAAARLDHVEQGRFPDIGLLRKFDAITFLDVIEHLADPWRALAAAKRSLAPGGVIVASIPNVRHWSVTIPLVRHGRWTYHEQGILDRTHLRFFTKSSMRTLFETSGYEVVANPTPLIVDAPQGRSKRTTLVRILPRAVREEFTTVAYGIVGRPR